jgi:hypothetical protein
MFDKDFGDGNYDYGGPSYEMTDDIYDGPQEKGPKMPNFSGVKIPKIDNAKLKPIIIVGVILMLIVAGVFYFISIQHTLTFNIKEANGPGVYAIIYIETLDGKRVYKNSNISTDQITLWSGEYELIVSKSGYDPYSQRITIPDDTPDGEYTITLHKTLNASLSVSTNNLTSLYGTKNISGEITIQNNSQETFQGELRAESEDVEVLFPNDSKDVFGITLPGNGPTTISFNLAMKKAVTSTKNVKVEFIIGGTTITEQINFEANPSPEIEIKEDELKELKITAGDSFTEEINIENKSKFSARDLILTIEPDDCCSDMLDWFEFSPYNEEKYQAKIDTLAKDRDSGDSAKLTLYVKPPITAKIGDTFKGHLVLDSETLEQPVSIIMQYAIDSIVKTDVELSTGTNPISVKTESVDKIFTISNKGDIDVENVVLKVKNSSTCDISWLKFLADDDLDSEITLGDMTKKGGVTSSQEVNVRLINTSLASGKMDCELSLEYDDPINTGEVVSDSTFYIINYTAATE